MLSFCERLELFSCRNEGESVSGTMSWNGQTRSLSWVYWNWITIDTQLVRQLLYCMQCLSGPKGNASESPEWGTWRCEELSTMCVLPFSLFTVPMHRVWHCCWLRLLCFGSRYPPFFGFVFHVHVASGKTSIDKLTIIRVHYWKLLPATWLSPIISRNDYPPIIWCNYLW